MTEGLQCKKDLVGTTATKWSSTVVAATATCSSCFRFFAQTRIQKNWLCKDGVNTTQIPTALKK